MRMPGKVRREDPQQQRIMKIRLIVMELEDSFKARHTSESLVAWLHYRTADWRVVLSLCVALRAYAKAG